MTDPALILLSLPVQFKRSHGPEGSKDGPEDFKVEVVAHINPDANKDTEVRCYERGIQIIERLGSLYNVALVFKMGKLGRGTV